MRIGKWIFAIWLAASVWALAAQPHSPAPAAQTGNKIAATPNQGANAKAAKTSSSAAKRRRRSRKNQRDPFVSPIVKRKGGGRIKCTGTGRQCLFAGDIVLQGVVEYSSGFIAIVASGNNIYFLRDEDPLADGKVERISRDSIVLQQRSSDVFGRPVVRTIIRKLKNPAV